MRLLVFLLAAVFLLPVRPAVAAGAHDADVPDLTVVTPWTGAAFAWLEGQLEMWPEAAGLNVRVLQLPLGEIRRQLLLPREEGEGADLLVGLPHDDIREPVRAGLLADLNAWTTAAYRSELPAATLSAFDSGEALYGLPLSVSGPALLVNTDLAGDAVPATYGEFIAAARQLNRGGTRGFLFDLENFYFSWAWLRGHGAQLFGAEPAGTPDPRSFTLDSDAALAGLEALRELRFGTGLFSGAGDHARADELFSAGRLAFTFAGPWSVAAPVAAGVPVEVRAVPPAVPGIPFSGFMTVEGVLVSALSPQPAVAVNAAKWLVRPAAQVELALQAGLVPARPSALAAAPEEASLLAGFSRALEHAEPVPTAALMNRVWPELGELLRGLNRHEPGDGELPGLLEQAATRLAE